MTPTLALGAAVLWQLVALGERWAVAAAVIATLWTIERIAQDRR